MTRPQPTWRSLLFVPVTSERFVSKAHTRGADAIILDLEDSILPAHKAAARAALPAAVPRVAQGGADVVVRINRPLDLAVADIAASVMPGVAALMLPKVMGPEHVRLLAELVTEREAALGMPIGHTHFLALIEQPAALPHLFAIAAAPRMAGMSVGGEDMATELARRASCRWDRWDSSRRSTTSTPIEPGCGAARRWASPRPPASIRRTCRSSMKSTAPRPPNWTAPAGCSRPSTPPQPTAQVQWPSKAA
jgi:citrate lyase beta subunit